MHNDHSYTTRNTNTNTTTDYHYGSMSIPRYSSPEQFIKELQTLRKSSHEKNKELFHNFHKTQIRKHFNVITKPKLEIENKIPLSLKAHPKHINKPYFFITKPKISFLSCSNAHHKTRNKINFTSPLKSFTEVSHVKCNSNEGLLTEQHHQHKHQHQQTFSKALAHCYNTISNTNSNSDFFKKVKVMRIMHLERKILSNKYKAYEEDQKAQIGEIEQKKYLLRKAYNMCKLYNEHLVMIISKLRKETDVELKKLDQLFYKKCDVENSLREIKSKIEKKKNELTLYHNYKLFLLMVKYKVKNINELPYDISVKYGLSSVNKKKAPIKRKETKTKNKKSLSRNSYIFKGTINNLNKRATLTVNNIKNGVTPTTTIINTNLPIFTNADEFITEILSLENSAFINFTRYNDIQLSKTPLLINKTNLITKNKDIQTKNNTELSIVESQLALIKQKHNTLQSTLHSIYNQITYNNQFKTVELIHEKLLHFLENIPINVSEVLNIDEYNKLLHCDDSIIHFKGRKMNKTIFLMEIMEKILHYYLNENKKYIGTKYYNVIIKRLSDLKRLEKYEQVKVMSVLNEMKLKEKMLSKWNKVNIIPLKNTYDKGKSIMMLNHINSRNKRNRISNYNSDEEAFQQFVTY